MTDTKKAINTIPDNKKATRSISLPLCKINNSPDISLITSPRKHSNPILIDLMKNNKTELKETLTETEKELTVSECAEYVNKKSKSKSHIVRK